ncbi:hypothetical protein PQO03_18680 [Lentisphaera profundi]|uniref:Uncharacterized protein n=1 Tax=Lentisphaera profundi TaxID=1658616 RepID=A0ABY7VYR6_9BACT|nr:hypothetical protein [Lentisphaera profundi]WDE97854.1 hypothetical protein PQO03_18680 [Lentisphaera profundi]
MSGCSRIRDVEFSAHILDEPIVMYILTKYIDGSKALNNRIISRSIIRLVQSILDDKEEIQHQLIDGAYYFYHKDLKLNFGATEYKKLIARESAINNLIYRDLVGRNTKMSKSLMAGHGSTWKTTVEFQKALQDIKMRISLSGNYRRSITDNNDWSKSCAIKELDIKQPPTDKHLVNTFFNLPEVKFIDSLDMHFYIAKHKGFVNENKIIQPYKHCKTDTGRMYGITSAHIQNKPKRFRNEICKGMRSIDIEACAHTILSQDYSRQTGDNLPYLSMMVNDRKIVREQLSNDIFHRSDGNSIKFIKSTIMPLVFGGEVHKHKPAKKKNDYRLNIMSLMQCNFEQAGKYIEKLKAHELYKGLLSDIKCVYENLEFDNYPSHRLNRPEQISWYYQNKEQFIMSFVKEYLGNENIQVNMHDGLIILNEVDTSFIENLVFSKTGYEVKFEQELIA